MSYQENIHHLMVEIGPVLDLEKVVEHRGGLSWTLSFEQDVTIDCRLDEENRKVVFQCVVSTVPAERKTELYEMLLQYNACWWETGGVSMALPEPGEPVYIVHSISVIDLHLSDLTELLGGLVEKTKAWRVLFGEPAGKEKRQEEGESVSDTLEAPHSFGILV